MAREIRTSLRDFNEELFREELSGVLPPHDLTMGGFHPNGPTTVTPNAAPRVITERNIPPGPPVQEVAQPGELWVDTDVPLEPIDLAALDAILVGHLETATTAQQDIDATTAVDIAYMQANQYSAEAPPAQEAYIDRLVRTFLNTQNKTPSW